MSTETSPLPPNIGIVTLHFQGNYGGMLQGYALYRALCKLGLQAILYAGPKNAAYDRSSSSFFINSPIRHIRDWIRFRLGIRSKKNIYLRHKSARAAIAFRKSNIPSNLDSTVSNNSIAAYVVGSDQVWRGSYARGMESLPYFFINFASPEQRNRSIAYAASFGTDEWEGTPEETDICRTHLQEFKAVSVREHSGIRLCKEHFGVEAVQMPDPTILLTPQDYGELMDRIPTKLPPKAYLASYTLDETNRTDTILTHISRREHLIHQPLQATPRARKKKDRIPQSPEQWLRWIQNAKVMVTDSFHGCVFSILFNIPFVCLGNLERGSSRFDSLFQTFHLQERLTHSNDPDEIVRILHTPIDWNSVNQILNSERKRGMDFLRTNLLT